MQKQPQVRVGKSSAGLGLYAEEDIKKGQFIIEYTGEKISTEEAQKRGGQYLFEINSKWTLDGRDRSHTARYINYSCDPNCEPRNVKNHIKIYAIKDIKKGTELTYNYGEEFFNEIIKKKGCKCEQCSMKKS
jgi:hypothetical protein